MSVGYVLADASTFFAEGVIRVLGRSPRLCFLGRSTTPASVRLLTRRHQPDVVVIGFEPPATSIGVARTLPVPAVVMTSSWRRTDVADALDAGVRGLLCKDVSATELEHTMVQVAAGGTVAQPGWYRGLNGVPGDPAAVRRHRPVDLTPREAEIVRMVVDGYSNKRVASALGIAHQTTKNHLHRVMVKVGVSTRTQLRDWAIGTSHAPVDSSV